MLNNQFCLLTSNADSLKNYVYVSIHDASNIYVFAVYRNARELAIRMHVLVCVSIYWYSISFVLQYMNMIVWRYVYRHGPTFFDTLRAALMPVITIYFAVACSTGGV